MRPQKPKPNVSRCGTIKTESVKHRSKFSPLLQWCCLHFSKISTIRVFNNRQTNKQSIIGEMPNQTELQKKNWRKKRFLWPITSVLVSVCRSVCVHPFVCLSMPAFIQFNCFFSAILKFQILRWCRAMGVQSKKNSMSFFKSSINFVLPPFQWWLQTFLVGDIFNKNEIMSSDVSGVLLDAWLVYSPLFFLHCLLLDCQVCD